MFIEFDFALQCLNGLKHDYKMSTYTYLVFCFVLFSSFMGMGYLFGCVCLSLSYATCWWSINGFVSAEKCIPVLGDTKMMVKCVDVASNFAKVQSEIFCPNEYAQTKN